MRLFLRNSARFLFWGILPIIILLVIYLITDPFKVLYNYTVFVKNNEKAYIGLNRGYVSTKVFENNCSKQGYNSFIYGNSRSIFYEISDWQKLIGKDCKPFHFDASSESLFGIHKKILFTDKNNCSIKNALLILDEEILKQDKPQLGHLTEIAPQLVNNENFIEFHFNNFKTFLSPKAFIPITYFTLTKKIPPIFKDALDYRDRSQDSITNEIKFESLEKMIENDTYYTKERKSVFYTRDTTKQKYSPATIKVTQKKMLLEIDSIFRKNNTNYKIIISPLYNQKKLNTKDKEYLDSLFGKENVFDYSGINSITNDYHNYYETSHYRPHITRQILQEIYDIKN